MHANRKQQPTLRRSHLHHPYLLHAGNTEIFAALMNNNTSDTKVPNPDWLVFKFELESNADVNMLNYDSGEHDIKHHHVSVGPLGMLLIWHKHLAQSCAKVLTLCQLSLQSGAKLLLNYCVKQAHNVCLYRQKINKDAVAYCLSHWIL